MNWNQGNGWPRCIKCGGFTTAGDCWPATIEGAYFHRVCLAAYNASKQASQNA